MVASEVVKNQSLISKYERKIKWALCLSILLYYLLTSSTDTSHMRSTPLSEQKWDFGFIINDMKLELGFTTVMLTLVFALRHYNSKLDLMEAQWEEEALRQAREAGAQESKKDQ